MSTRIVLEDPYKSLWDRGYLRKSSQSSRMLVDLVNDSKNRTTTSFARYRYSVYLGYEVPDGYEIDHIDTDHTNDDLSNLQMLTVEEHIAKSAKEKAGRNTVELTCPNCGKSFEIEVRNIRPEKVRNFCSRRCNALFYNAAKNLNRRSSGVWEREEEIRYLRSSGKSDYQIAEELNLNRASIYYARKKLNIP